MLPEGHSAGALTKERAMALVHEALEAREDRDRYRLAVDKLGGTIPPVSDSGQSSDDGEILDPLTEGQTIGTPSVLRGRRRTRPSLSRHQRG